MDLIDVINFHGTKGSLPSPRVASYILTKNTNLLEKFAEQCRTSGAIQMTNTTIPSPILPSQFSTRKSRMLREKTIKTAVTTSTRSGYNHSTLIGATRSSARNAMNAQKGARYGSEGYFASSAATPNTSRPAPGWP